MNKKVFAALLLVVYLVSAGVSYAVFSKSSATVSLPGNSDVPTTAAQSDVKNDFEAILFDESQPKTEECPLNGALYSKEQKEWWEQHRPLGIMIENHEEARPQSGISFADVVYEAVAEGGITRTMSVYYCRDAGIVGPIRSARTYFLDWISEYGPNPLYVHVGGANCNPTTGSGCLNGAKADALGQIEKYGWQNYNDMSQFNISFPVFKQRPSRNGREVAVEHTMYSTTSQLWGVAKERGLTQEDEEGTHWNEGFTPYSFKDDAKEAARSASQVIDVEWWGPGDYAVQWKFDKTSNTYLRSNGGEPHVDQNIKKQLAAKNVVVMFQRESAANDGYDGNVRRLYANKGEGTAWIFVDGKQIKGTWSKEDRESRTQLFDATGKEVSFNRGQIWFEIVDINADVTVR